MKCIYRSARSHSIWRDDMNRLVIADQSGPTPETTEDGPMYFDNSRKHTCVGTDRFHVPVTDGDGAAYWVLTIGEIVKRLTDFDAEQMKPSAVDAIGENTMTNKEQFILISQIAKRALADVFKPQQVSVQLIDICMDLENVHKVCPLRLQDLLDADAGNFGHDIAGIYRHFNRQTLCLEDCFTPRFAA